MHFLMLPFGTGGDVYPYIGIGVGLKKRGHRVTVITHTHFRELIARVGLEFVDLDDSSTYYDTMNHPDHWDPKRGLRKDARLILRESMRKHYAAIEDLYVPGETVAVTSHGGYGVRIAQDKLGIPVVSAHITPFLIRSVARPSAQPIADWLLSILFFHVERELFFQFVDRVLADPLLGPEINRFRAELGLPRVRRIVHRWIHSPQLILGLFPHWMAEPIPEDWPRNVICTGFPFFDQAEDALSPEIDDFLKSGKPPIVFTPGTGVTHARHFFEAGVYACRKLKQRGLLLTRFPEQVPENLPETIRHIPYLPLSQVLPRSAALVSHGGIGTVAQALRAGIPQLMMPMSYEQPENARRLRRLGVARALPPERFTGPAAAQRLRLLLQSPAIQTACKDVASRFPAGDPVRETCNRLEEFAARVAAGVHVNGAASRAPAPH